MSKHCHHHKHCPHHNKHCHHKHCHHYHKSCANHHHHHHRHCYHHKMHHHHHRVCPPTPPTVLKWRCSGSPDFVCVEAVDGIYDTELECIAACGSPSPTAPTLLGRAVNFRVLAHETITNNTGPTTINGDLGLSPGTSVTGAPTVLGTSHVTDTAAANAQLDLTAAYNAVAAMPATTILTGQNLGGKTLLPGVYFFASSAQLTGNLKLDAAGDASAVWMFQIGSALTVDNASSVTLINGGQADNVYWQVGSSATLGTTAAFVGNILALASISLDTGATLSGRALASTGAVTLLTNTIGP
jgi:hypothetical protein